MTQALVLDGSALTAAEVESVARGGRRVGLSDSGRAALDGSHKRMLELLSNGTAHYGLNTGFGSLSTRRIEGDRLRDLQLNLIRSHAAGAGAALPDEVVRGMMLLLAASLTRGYSGVRAELVLRVLDLLNAGVTPVVPEIGSVGASGDLAPMAHVGLGLIGEGRVRVGGREMGGGEALAGAGLGALELGAKEGLAIINGTHLMTARMALAMVDFDRLFGAALVAAAMSIDACRATDTFLDDRVYAVRNQAGPREVAARLRSLLAGSEIVSSHREGDARVQDPYSIRCAPLVLGSAAELVCHLRASLDAELGAVTDNPVVLREPDAIVAAGNFHGMPVALPLDALAIAVAHVAGIAERRVYHMLSAFDEGSQLPPFLSPRPGLCSGLMIVQYTAAAACNELIGLAVPASVSNLPTSAGMEDYNSYGPRSAAKAARGIELARVVVAIELLCGAEALEHHRPLRSGGGVERAHAVVRGVVGRLVEDRPPSPDIAALGGLIEGGAFA